MNNDPDNNLLFFPLSSKKRKGLTGKGIMMSKRVKHSRIYGPIKEQKGWVESVCVCLSGGTCSRPDHSFLLTDAGPRGESWKRRGGSSPGGYWEEGRVKTVNKGSYVCLLRNVGARSRSRTV